MAIQLPQIPAVLRRPLLAMLLVQCLHSGMQILNKIALNSGMSPFVLVTYRQLGSTVFLLPFAYFYEWRSRPSITRPVFLQLSLCAVLGVVMNQCFYIAGLKYTTPTIAAAVANLLPAVTFVMAVLFRQENLNLQSRLGKAKVAGTVISIAGAMVTCFYRGGTVLYASGVASPRLTGSKRSNHQNWLGPILVVVSCVSTSGWMIVLGRLKRTFYAPYTTTTMTGLLAFIPCGIIAFIAERKGAVWSVTDPFRLAASIYSGVVGSGVAFSLMTWCIQQEGALYVSLFSPIMLLIVAVFGWFLLDGDIYLGNLVGAVAIVGGLYLALWAMGREERQRAINAIQLELQPPNPINEVVPPDPIDVVTNEDTNPPSPNEEIVEVV